MALTTEAFDPTDYLATDEALVEYINAALETDDPAFIAHSLGIVARAKGMARVARQAGLGRESLYKALCAEGNPEFVTVLKVVEALGLRLTAAAGRSGGARRRKRAAWIWCTLTESDFRVAEVRDMFYSSSAFLSSQHWTKERTFGQER